MNNVANSGGAIYATSLAQTEINSSTFIQNSADDLGITNQNGAAIYCSDCILNIRQSTFTAQVNGLATITIHNRSATIINSTIHANNMIGIRTQNADLLIIQSTITDNVNTNLSHFSSDGSKNITIERSIIANSVGSNCGSSQKPISLGYNIVSDASCLFSELTDMENTDALLGPLQDNSGPTPTRNPDLSSPAIDTIAVIDCVDSDDLPLNHDQRNITRPQGSSCDVGSVENNFEQIFNDGFE